MADQPVEEKKPGKEKPAKWKYEAPDREAVDLATQHKSCKPDPKSLPTLEHVWICPIELDLKPGDKGTKSVKRTVWNKMLWKALKLKKVERPGKHHIWKEIAEYSYPTIPRPTDTKKRFKWSEPPLPGLGLWVD